VAAATAESGINDTKVQILACFTSTNVQNTDAVATAASEANRALMVADGMVDKEEIAALRKDRKRVEQV